jgi:hypothetical protein
MSTIIAFAGRKQSGKTTCSENICDYYNSKYSGLSKVYNFADPLKQDICMNILGLTYDQCYGSDIDKNTTTHIEWDGQKLTAREVMQIVGTDIFRKMYNGVWVNATISKINREHMGLAVIADCRFPNEVEAVKNAGGIVIKLTRNLYNSNHASEIALDPENYSPDNFDLVVHNEKIGIQEQNDLIVSFLQKRGVFSL